MPMFERALEPAGNRLSAKKRRDLVLSLSAATGLEVYIILKDICQLPDTEIDRVAERNIRAILSDAFAES